MQGQAGRQHSAPHACVTCSSTTRAWRFRKSPGGHRTLSSDLLTDECAADQRRRPRQHPTPIITGSRRGSGSCSSWPSRCAAAAAAPQRRRGATTRACGCAVGRRLLWPTSPRSRGPSLRGAGGTPLRGPVRGAHTGPPASPPTKPAVRPDAQAAHLSTSSACTPYPPPMAAATGTPASAHARMTSRSRASTPSSLSASLPSRSAACTSTPALYRTSSGRTSASSRGSTSPTTCTQHGVRAPGAAVAAVTRRPLRGARLGSRTAGVGAQGCRGKARNHGPRCP